MLIENIYKTLHEHNLCNSAYDFSVHYLGKSKSYYSVLKARNETPSIEAITTLETALKNTTTTYSSNKHPFYIKNRDALTQMTADIERYREQRCNELLTQHLYEQTV